MLCGELNSPRFNITDSQNLSVSLCLFPLPTLQLTASLVGDDHGHAVLISYALQLAKKAIQCLSRHTTLLNVNKPRRQHPQETYSRSNTAQALEPVGDLPALPCQHPC